MTVCEKGLEAAAEAAFNHGRSPDETWQGAHSRTKMSFRESMRAAITAYESARSAEPVAGEARTAPIPAAVLKAAEVKLRAHPTPEGPDV